MKISLLGWKTQGLRIPDMSVDLTTSSGRKAASATFMMMQNGTGKSTVCELMRATLSGTASTWDPPTVRSFQHRHFSQPVGSIRIQLEVTNPEPKLLTYQLLLNFEEGSIHYKTTYDNGRKDFRFTPSGVGSLFNENVVELLIFNAELPTKLLEKTETKAGTVIESYYHLHHLNTIKDQMENYRKRKINDIQDRNKIYIIQYFAVAFI